MWKCDYCWARNDDTLDHCRGCELSRVDSRKRARKTKLQGFIPLLIVIIILLGVAVWLYQLDEKIFGNWIVSIVATMIIPGVYRALRRH